MSFAKLDTAHSSLVLRSSATGVSFEHLGRPLSELPTVAVWQALRHGPVPHGELDHRPENTLLTTEDGLHNTRPDFRASRNGKRLFVSLGEAELQQTANHVRVTQRDTEAGVAIETVLSACESGVYRMRTAVCNTGVSPLAVDWLSAASLSLPPACQDVVSLRGFWANEFQASRCQLQDQLIEISSDRGRSSHQTHPSLLMGSAGFSEETGDVILATLAFSGSHRLCAFRGATGDLRLQAGTPLAPGECLLEPEQRFDTPEVLFAFSGTGMNGLRAQFRRFWARETPSPSGAAPARPVHFNSWEACYFEQSDSKTRALIDAAAEMGAERFVLDDGWMQDRHAPGVGLGDWRTDSTKYPQGLQPISRYARSRGLSFGLWLEPEMATLDSQIAAQHPEWLISPPRGEAREGRGQRLLDLSQAPVATHILDCLRRLMREAEPDYIKWDMNRDIADAGFAENVFHSTLTRAFYDLLKQFRAEHPHIVVEVCAAGGARCDAGSLLQADRLWPSDSMDSLQRMRVLRHASCLLPPSRLGWHIGSQCSHTSGLMLPVSTRCALATLGHMGLELDPHTLSCAERAKVKTWVDFYRQHRDWMANADYSFLDTNSGEQDILLIQDRDERALLYVLQREHPKRGTSSLLRLPQLAARSYLLRLLNPDDCAFTQAACDWHLGAPVEVNGTSLANAGIRLPFLRMGYTTVVLLEKSCASAA
ncbi:MAG: alpha-galactosidase [Congregibacter sp.]